MTLKQWLSGNSQLYWSKAVFGKKQNCKPLYVAAQIPKEYQADGYLYGTQWFVDVLDDGIAITYYPFED